MRALITGASGFLGNELVRQLLREGVSVVAAVGPEPSERERSRISELEQRGTPLVSCDLRREAPLGVVPSEWDVLFHLAAFVRTEKDSQDVHVNDAGTRRLLSQLSLGTRRVVFTSTLAVADNAPRGEITPTTVCSPRTAYGRTKLAAESIVREICRREGAAWTILRLPTLYGRGYRQHGMFDVLAAKLARGSALSRVMWPGRMALLSVEDAARILYRAAATPQTRDRLFLASSNENPRTWEIARAIAAAKGLPYRPLPLPRLVAGILRASLGPWWQAGFIPYSLQIAAWRAHLLLNGLYCDGGELNNLLGVESRDWQQGFRHMYASPSS
jgi:UDP-N-acetyl-alpha-D-quinovosamine dehydrogenase